VISGDVLFKGSIGRHDLPGSNKDDLFKSLTTVMMTLSDDTIVYSGHGPETTIKEEKANNPFLNEKFFFAV
jgi:glyoxylase-like metal-dependent hydrolase (beta-lactamase superfamily II)